VEKQLRRGGRGVGQQKSDVWEFFAYDAAAKYSKCNICGHKVPKKSAGNNWKHLEKHHYREYQEYKRQKNEQQTTPPFGRRNVSPAGAASGAKQLTLAESLQPKKSYSANDPKQQEITSALAMVFSANSWPHSLIEDELFRFALSVMDSRYVFPARDEMKKAITGQTEKLKEEMAERLKKAHKISICVDLWTKQSLSESYIGVTAHFYDKEKNSVCRILLALCIIEEQHTVEVIHREVEKCLEEWKIPDSKVRCIVTDNGSSVIKAFRDSVETLIAETEQVSEEEDEAESGDTNLEVEIDEESEFERCENEHFATFGRQKRISCFAHSLVLACRASVEKDQTVQGIIALSFAVVKAFTTSTVNTTRLIKLSGQKLVSPACTQWLYVYYVLDRLLNLRPQIDQIIHENQLNVGLSEPQWRMVENLVNFLKEFAHEVAYLEGEKYSTIHQVIPLLLELIAHCEEFENVTGFGAIGRNVKLELERRFSSILSPTDLCYQPLFAVATFLDPSLRNCLSLVGQFKSARADVKCLAQVYYTEQDPDDHDNDHNAHEVELSAADDSGGRFHRLKAKIGTVARASSHSTLMIIENELERYLMEESKMEILEYWQIHKQNFPALFNVACDILSIPATSTPIERVFSHAGIASTGCRNWIGPHSLSNEMIMKLNHFL
uniref:HAT C-terminal dimerisation domain-containing protein n=2 Tax=Latimeria chalumnae TaxID=7897 RepID=H3BA99_LATCH